MSRMNAWRPFSLLLVKMASPLSAPAQDQPIVPVDTMIDVGGHRLHFKVWERQSPVTLLFEHGGAANLASWDSIPDIAARRFPVRVVAYDRAGLGSSETGPVDLTPVQEIDQLRRALAVLGGHRVVIVGHSFGGLLALYHAFRHQDSVAGLVLVDPMNVPFIRVMSLDWLNRTAPDIPNPATPRETTIVRMKRTMADLVARVEPATREAGQPMVVISSGLPWWYDKAADEPWRQSHRDFVAAHPGRQLMVATRSTHGIPRTEPGLVIEAIGRILSLVDP